jgi:hypothetical protein
VQILTQPRNAITRQYQKLFEMEVPEIYDGTILLRGAVREAGRALTRSGSTRSEYADRMIAVIEEFGAYVVIAPGLPHKLWNPGPDPLVLLCCCAPPYSHDDTFMVD